MTELESLNLKAARDYLQTALFIDDNIFANDSGVPLTEQLTIPTRQSTYDSSDERSPPSKLEEQLVEEDDGPVYSPKNIVTSFSKEGIICALYEPQPGFETGVSSEVYKMCERPDILILDWDFSNDRGVKALGLISELCRKGRDEFPHHTRLIAIYTSDSSLIGVSNSIADRLLDRGLEAVPIDTQLRLKSGAVRLVIYGKPISRIGEDADFTVEESQLAPRLVDEFVRMHTGITPSLALSGLSSIRRNSKRILDRMNGNLDGPFLLHRKMVAAREEAFHQIPELLAEELRAVIEDNALSDEQVHRLANEFEGNPKIEEADKELLLSGKSAKNLAKDLKNDDGVIPTAHRELASLYSSKTFYSEKNRFLSFGTVVRFRETVCRWSYGVCLVPVCDSVHLDSTRKASFPFWALHENNYSRGFKKFGFVLTLDNEDQISLGAGGKAGDMLWTESFTVDPDTKTVSAKKDDQTYALDASERKYFEWIGQLKPLHAHRIARDITDGLGRVGVSEVDWIRLLLSS